MLSESPLSILPSTDLIARAIESFQLTYFLAFVKQPDKDTFFFLIVALYKAMFKVIFVVAESFIMIILFLVHLSIELPINVVTKQVTGYAFRFKA